MYSLSHCLLNPSGLEDSPGHQMVVLLDLLALDNCLNVLVDHSVKVWIVVWDHIGQLRVADGYSLLKIVRKKWKYVIIWVNNLVVWISGSRVYLGYYSLKQLLVAELFVKLCFTTWHLIIVWVKVNHNFEYLCSFVALKFRKQASVDILKCIKVY